MHIEVRRLGGKRLYYLAHSFREGGKPRKVRKYLGADLGNAQLGDLRKRAEKELLDRIESSRRIRDPLHTILSPEEKKAALALIKAEWKHIGIRHLSEKDWKKFTEAFSYDTNAIEGSTVTASEAAGIIRKGAWPKYRTRQEIAETYGVAEAVAYIRKTDENLSVALIRELHRIVFKNSKEYAGQFREKGVEVAVVDGSGEIMHRGAPQKDVPRLLKGLSAWYERNRDEYHPIVLAAVVHDQFENIHPFRDGNGRVGRLLLNNILIKHGLPPVNIELKNRTEYYRSLQAYEKLGDIRPTIQLILKEYRRLAKTLRK